MTPGMLPMVANAVSGVTADPSSSLGYLLDGGSSPEVTQLSRFLKAARSKGR